MSKLLKKGRRLFYRYDNADIGRLPEEIQLVVRLIQNKSKLNKTQYPSFNIHRDIRFQRPTRSQNRASKIKPSNRGYDIIKTPFEIVKHSNDNKFILKKMLGSNFSKERLYRLNIINIRYIETINGWLYSINVIDPNDFRTIEWALFSIKYANKTIIPVKKKEVFTQKRKKSVVFHELQETQNLLEQNRELPKLNLSTIQSMNRKNCRDKPADKGFFDALKVKNSKLKKR